MKIYQNIKTTKTLKLEQMKIEEQNLDNLQKPQLNTGAVMWRCSRQFRMKDTKEVCFKNGGLYKQVKKQPLTLKDEDGIAHELCPHWVKWFHNVTQLCD